MVTITRFAPAGMTDTDSATSTTGGKGTFEATTRGYPASITSIGFAKVREFENTFTPAAITSGPALRAATTISVGDYVKMFTIPANHVVLAARLEVVAPGTGAGTLAMSDGAALGTAQAVNAAGQQTYATSKVYTANTDITLSAAGAAITDGTYRIVVLAMDMTGQETTSLLTS